MNTTEPKRKLIIPLQRRVSRHIDRGDAFDMSWHGGSIGDYRSFSSDSNGGPIYQVLMPPPQALKDLNEGAPHFVWNLGPHRAGGDHCADCARNRNGVTQGINSECWHPIVNRRGSLLKVSSGCGHGGGSLQTETYHGEISKVGIVLNNYSDELRKFLIAKDVRISEIMCADAVYEET